jgi:DNA-binding transcriptional LysR family regulator
MDVHQLRCFVAVAEESHFGRAAERLHLTSSPVSRAIKDLERELRADLFIRRYHQVELTGAGTELLGRARRILAEFDDLKVVVSAVSRHAPQVVHVGGTYLAPPALLDRIVTIAEEVADGRPVDVRTAPSAELLPEVESGAIELAFVHLPLDAPHLDSLTVARYRFFVAMRSDDALATASELELADLTDRTVALTPAKVQPLAMNRVYQYLHAAGLTRTHQLPETDTALLASHVRRSRDLALTLSPASSGPFRIFDDPAFAVVPLRDDGFEFTAGVAWRRDRLADPLVTALVGRVRDAWADGPELI